MKEYFKRLIAAKQKRAAELRELIKNAATADEVRSLGATLQAVLDELTDAQAQLAQLGDDEENGGNQDEERGANPMHNFRQVGAYSAAGTETRDNDPTNTVEYRTAFMNFVCRGTAVPMNLRENLVTVTSDTTAVIPTTILNEIIKEMKSYGEIFARVRKLNVQGGVEIPILSLTPKANWVGETTPSETQKLQANDSVIFSYFGLECKIAQSLLVNVVTLDMFQEQFVALAAEAIVAELDKVIFTGDGKGKPMGILNDTRVPAANKITLTPTEFASWSAWKKKVFAKMKKAYRKGSFVMAQATFDGYIDGMVDDVGQPIGRTNYGIADGETYRFGGKEVLTVEEDVIAAYDSAADDAVVAAFVDLAKYGINSNMTMQVVKWTDNDTNEVKNKAILICDGKLIDPYGVIIVKKGPATAAAAE